MHFLVYELAPIGLQVTLRQLKKPFLVTDVPHLSFSILLRLLTRYSCFYMVLNLFAV